MKILIEPSRLGKFLSAVLIYKGKPLLENVVAEFGENGVVVRDLSLDVAGINAVYAKKYFLEYDEAKEDIPLTKSLLEKLNYGFKDEKVNVFTDEGHIVVSGKTETYNEPLLDVEKAEFPIPMKMSDVGIVPETLKAKVQVLLNAEALTLPPAEKYRFDCDGKGLKVTIEDVGKYTKTFKPSKTSVMEEISVGLDGAYFQHIVNNIEGEVWVSFTEKGVVFSQKTKAYCITYLLSTLEEE